MEIGGLVLAANTYASKQAGSAFFAFFALVVHAFGDWEPGNEVDILLVHVEGAMSDA